MPLSRVYFVASAFLLALGSVLAKLLLSEGHVTERPDPLPFLALQLLGGVLFLLVVQTIVGWRHQPLRDLARPALAGLVLGVGSVGTIMALALISASEASVVFASQPVMILILARVFLGERCGVSITVLSLIAVAGVGVIVGSGGVNASDARAAGIAFAVLSTASAAIYVIWMRRLSGELDVLVALITVICMAFALATLLWGAAYATGLVGTQIGDTASAPLAFGTGALHYGAAFYLYLLGLRHTDASEAGVYLSIVPVFTIALAWSLLNERLEPLQWLGAAMVIGSIAAVSWLAAKENAGHQWGGRSSG